MPPCLRGMAAFTVVFNKKIVLNRGFKSTERGI